MYDCVMSIVKCGSGKMRLSNMVKTCLILREPPPHQIFLKRAIFEKIILLYLLGQIYTKITKKCYF